MLSDVLEGRTVVRFVKLKGEIACINYLDSRSTHCDGMSEQKCVIVPNTYRPTKINHLILAIRPRSDKFQNLKMGGPIMFAQGTCGRSIIPSTSDIKDLVGKC